VQETGWPLGPEGRGVPVAPEDRGGPIGAEHIPEWVDHHHDRIVAHLEHYFRRADDSVAYQGQHFEWFQQRSSPLTFTENDLLAIGALSVALPAQTARLLLEDRDNTFGELLRKCHELIEHRRVGNDLSTCPTEWLEAESSPFIDLYNALRCLHGSGKVITSKLMACKFPTLIPIRDHLVEVLLGMETSKLWWMPIRLLLTRGVGVDSTVGSILQGIDGGVDFGHVCVTRRLDVVLWMEARSRGLGRRHKRERIANVTGVEATTM